MSAVIQAYLLREFFTPDNVLALILLGSNAPPPSPPLFPPAARPILSQDNVDVFTDHPHAPAAGSKPKNPVIAPRSDVLAHYPFVDDTKGAQGGGVGGALRRETPSTPLQNLAKREIK